MGLDGERSKVYTVYTRRKPQEKERGRMANKVGRPKNTESVKATADQQNRVIRSQRIDCGRLRRNIKELAARGDLDPAAVGQLARATAILHERERVAYDLDSKQARARSVIIIPVSPQSIEEWHEAAAEAIEGARAALPSGESDGPVRHVEDMVQGQVPSGFRDGTSESGATDD